MQGVRSDEHRSDTDRTKGPQRAEPGVHLTVPSCGNHSATSISAFGDSMILKTIFIEPVMAGAVLAIRISSAFIKAPLWSQGYSMAGNRVAHMVSTCKGFLVKGDRNPSGLDSRWPRGHSILPYFGFRFAPLELGCILRGSRRWV